MISFLNNILERYGDPIALGLSVLLAFYFGIVWRKDANTSARGLVAGLMYFGPAFLISCMVLHLMQNGLHAVAYLQQYGSITFHYYSLLLFGCIVGHQGLLLLKACRWHTKVTGRFSKALLHVMVRIIVISLPTFIFTPIGLFPTVLMGWTTIFALLVHRRAKPEQETLNTSNNIIMWEEKMVTNN